MTGSCFFVRKNLISVNILPPLLNFLQSLYNQNMKFQSELLIFVLLLATNLRVFFVSHVRRDPLVALAPFTFLLSVFQILAWGLDFFSLLAFILALLVLLSNFHAIFRYWEKLYIDHYSVLMKVWAVFTVTLSLVFIVALVWFAPVESKSSKIGVKETQYRLRGNFRTGFSDAVAVNIADAFISEFSKISLPSEENPNQNKNDEVIIFFPDKRADTMNYVPYLQQLALNGCDVFSGDFYSKDCRYLHSFADNKILRRTFMVIKSYMNKLQFESQREFYSYNIKMEAEEMLKFVSEKIESERGGSDFKCTLICDVMGHSALTELKEKYPEQIKNIIFIDDFSGYETKGFGLIEQTDPLLATVMGKSKDYSKRTLNLLCEKTWEVLKNDAD